MTNDDSVYRYGGNEAIMVRNEIWGTQQATDELNRLTRELTAALATVDKCNKANDRWRLRHVDEWHEDHGPAIWFPNAPGGWEDIECFDDLYMGTPLDTQAPAEDMYWWIPIPDFAPMIAAASAKGGANT